MRDINVNGKSTQRWSNTPEEQGKLEKRTASGRSGISHWKKPFHILKPPLSDFLLADVNTERVLNVPVFLHKEHHLSGRAHELQIATRSQHRSLADDNLKECDGDLANIRATRKDLVGVSADVTRLDICGQSALEFPKAQCPHVKRNIYMSFTFVSFTRN